MLQRMSIAKKELAARLFVLGRDRLYFDNARGARQALADSLSVQTRLKPLFVLVFSYLPKSLRRLVIRTWRIQQDSLLQVGPCRQADDAPRSQHAPG